MKNIYNNVSFSYSDHRGHIFTPTFTNMVTYKIDKSSMLLDYVWIRGNGRGLCVCGGGLSICTKHINTHQKDHHVL